MVPQPFKAMRSALGRSANLCGSPNQLSLSRNMSLLSRRGVAFDSDETGRNHPEPRRRLYVHGPETVFMNALAQPDPHRLTLPTVRIPLPPLAGRAGEQLTGDATGQF